MEQNYFGQMKPNSKRFLQNAKSKCGTTQAQHFSPKNV